MRFGLETLRTGNWVLLGIPTAMLVSGVVIVGALAVLAFRHRSGAAEGDRWGDPPELVADADEDDAVADADEWIEEDEEADGHDEPAGSADPAGGGEPVPGHDGSGEPVPGHDGSDRPA